MKFTLRLEDSVYDEIKKEADRRGMSVNSLISFVLSDRYNDLSLLKDLLMRSLKEDK